MIPATKRTSSRPATVFATMFLLGSCLMYGQALVRSMSSHTRVGDFFQEWASGRNYCEGLPIYTPQAITAWRYLQYQPDPQRGVFVRMNGHPPTSVLLGLPFAQLSYSNGFLLWNILSIVALVAAMVLIVRLERVRFGAAQWLTLAAMLLSNCLLQHLMMGQMGTLLLLLIVGTAWADDRKHPVLAGVLLGTATALKLFPALLFLYFVVNRNWKTIGVGLAVVASWILVSIGLFGIDTYSHYFKYAVPEVMRYRDWWANYSITGLWFKLFDGTSRQTEPLWFSPLTARLGALICVAAMVALAAYVCQRGRANRRARQSSFALMITAMVLASPVAWDHYFLLLAWPLVRLANRLPATAIVHGFMGAVLAVLWLNPLVLWVYCTDSFRPSTPAEVLLFLSWPFYAVATVFAFAAVQTLRDASRGPALVAASQVKTATMSNAEPVGAR